MYDGQNTIRGAGAQAYALGDEKRKYDDAVMQAKMQVAGQLGSVNDRSPVDMALDQLQKVLDVGHEEMQELRARLVPVTDQGNEKACSGIADSSSPHGSMPSQIEGRIAHLIERAVVLQASLREMRISLRI